MAFAAKALGLWPALCAHKLPTRYLIFKAQPTAANLSACAMGGRFGMQGRQTIKRQRLRAVQFFSDGDEGLCSLLSPQTRGGILGDEIVKA